MALSWDQVRRILVIVMIVSFLVAILGAVGEYLGWWDATGEVLMTSGTVVGALAGIVTLYGGASRDQVDAVQQAVVRGNRKLGKLDQLDKLDELDVIQAELDRQTGALDRQIEILGAIRDRL